MTPLFRVSSEGGVGVALSPSHGPRLYSSSSPIVVVHRRSPLLAIRRRCPLLVIHRRRCPLFVPRSLSSRRRRSQFVVAPLSTPRAEARGSRQRRSSHKYKYST
ncbi:hypothetical protein L208DRAFT_1408651 [Tricholoma matsutake]|nr:hypothetical protein L208DRAFT_1408651 [Tricholoma matsutake 945]